MKRWCVGFVFLVALLVAYVATADTWLDDGNYDLSWYDENASEYEIKSEKQLAGLAYLVNDRGISFSEKQIQIEDDISLAGHDWIPVGTTSNEFQGILDGGDKKHVVRDISINSCATDSSGQKYAGFFSWLSGATIKNLILEGQIVSTTAIHFMGAFCAEASDSRFVECESRFDFPRINTGYVGGFLGVAENVSFEDCDNYSNINLATSNGVGGLVGYALDDNLSINESSNYGNVSSYYYPAGGFVGFSEAKESNISSCINTGDVSLRLTYASQSGGIVGFNKSGNMNISFCVNEGAITGADAGGIIGRNAEEYNNTLAQITIENCKNTESGKITVNQAYDYLHANTGGGICGMALNALINHCINEGEIYANAYSYSFCGGIAGNNYASDIINCANYGDIKGNAQWAGGIAGGVHYMQQTIPTVVRHPSSRVLNSYNSGEIHAQYCAGGIVGAVGMSNEEAYAIIHNCYSRGNVSANSNTNVAGIAGKLFFGTIDHSYYLKTSDNLPSYSYGTDGVHTTDILNVGYVNTSNRDDSEVYLSDYITYEFDIDDQLSTESSDKILLTELQNVMLATDGYMPWVIAQGYNDFYPVFGQPVTFVIKENGVEGTEKVDENIVQHYTRDDYSLPEHVYYFADTDVINFSAIAYQGYAFKEAKYVDGKDYIKILDEEGDDLSFRMGPFPVTIELFYEKAKVKATVSIIWDDSDNIDGIRPSSLSISLALNNQIIKDDFDEDASFVLVPDANGNWKHTFTLPYVDYSNIEIWEGSATGYARSLTSVIIDGSNINAVVVNKHIHVAAESTLTNENMVNIAYSVMKDWDDTANERAQVVTHPTITVNLYADGILYRSGEILPEDDLDTTEIDESTTVIFSNIPKYKDNEEDELIPYTILEEINNPNWIQVTEKDEDGNNVTVFYSLDGLGKYIASTTGPVSTKINHDTTATDQITNTYKMLQTEIDVEVTKYWKDHQNENDVRPQSIKLGLFKPDGTTLVKELILSNPNAEETEDKNDLNSWTGKFEDLPIYDEDGKVIKYNTYIVKEWDEAESRWMDSGESAVIEDSYVYDYNVMTEAWDGGTRSAGDSSSEGSN